MSSLAEMREALAVAEAELDDARPSPADLKIDPHFVAVMRTYFLSEQCYPVDYQQIDEALSKILSHPTSSQSSPNAKPPIAPEGGCKLMLDRGYYTGPHEFPCGNLAVVSSDIGKQWVKVEGVHCRAVDSKPIYFNDLTFTGQIRVSSGSVIVEDCDIRMVDPVSAVVAEKGAVVVLRRCTLRVLEGAGVVAKTGASAYVQQCVIDSRRCSTSIAVIERAAAVVKETTVRGGRVGIHVDGSSTLDMERSFVTGCYIYGILGSHQAEVALHQNRVEHCLGACVAGTNRSTITCLQNTILNEEAQSDRICRGISVSPHSQAVGWELREDSTLKEFRNVVEGGQRCEGRLLRLQALPGEDASAGEDESKDLEVNGQGPIVGADADNSHLKIWRDPDAPRQD